MLPVFLIPPSPLASKLKHFKDNTVSVLVACSVQTQLTGTGNDSDSSRDVGFIFSFRDLLLIFFFFFFFRKRVYSEQFWEIELRNKLMFSISSFHGAVESLQAGILC